jgi:hypothetical protein
VPAERVISVLVPGLDAAYIQGDRGPQSSQVQNGMLLRSYLLRLFDEDEVAETSPPRSPVAY